MSSHIRQPLPSHIPQASIRARTPSIWSASTTRGQSFCGRRSPAAGFAAWFANVPRCLIGIERKIRDCPGGGVGLAVQRPITLTSQNCACNRPERIETGPRSALYPGLLTN